MPRAIWSGTSSCGLVNVPLRMYSAVSQHGLGFHSVHAPDGGRIGYERCLSRRSRPI